MNPQETPAQKYAREKYNLVVGCHAWIEVEGTWIRARIAAVDHVVSTLVVPDGIEHVVPHQLCDTEPEVRHA